MLYAFGTLLVLQVLLNVLPAVLLGKKGLNIFQYGIWVICPVGMFLAASYPLWSTHGAPDAAMFSLGISILIFAFPASIILQILFIFLINPAIKSKKDGQP